MTDQRFYKRKKQKHINKLVLVLFLIIILVASSLVFIYIKSKSDTKNQNSNSKTKDVKNSEQWEKGYDLPIEDAESKEADKDCAAIAKEVKKKAKSENVNISKIMESDTTNTKEALEKIILDVIDQKEDTVIGTGIYADIHNYKKLEEFIDKAKKQKKSDIVLYKIHEDGGFVREKFTFDGKDMYVLYSNVVWSKADEPELQDTSDSYNRVKKWKYTDKGWFCYELYVPEPPEVTEVINSNTMIRILPFKKEYKEFSEKYLLPLGYQGNNLLCSEWDENNMSKLDYCGLYEYFYAMQTGTGLDQEKYLDGIPKEEFTSVITKYLSVTPEQLTQYALYDSNRGVFAWGRLGCMTYSPNPFGTSVPEVTEMTQNEDGTTTVKVDAICEWYGDDQIFSHELKVRINEDGSIEYLSNHVLEPGLDNIPKYQYRLDGVVQ